METAVKRLYEGMFLVDSALAAQDWQKVLDEVGRILSRAHAEVVSLKKWDERRLCHDVKGVSRGTYILVYFHCDTAAVGGIEHDSQLSELILRTLILRTEKMTQADIDKPTPLEAVPEKPAETEGVEPETAVAEGSDVVDSDEIA